jgi:2-haloacid dehalogenase
MIALQPVANLDEAPMSSDAFVFDAYGTLFDPLSIAARVEALLPGHGADVAKLWRSKQLEYAWLGSLMEARSDFAAVTTQALEYALAALALPLDGDGRRTLLEAWTTLAPYPDAVRTLARLAPRPRWILSNGTLAMLEPLVRTTGLGEHLDGILSVDAAGVYKPSPRVYALACERLALPASRIAFVSSNGWDAAGAKHAGFTTWWINRAGLPIERHAPTPDHVVGSLDEIAV